MMRTLRFIVVIGCICALSAETWAQTPDQRELARTIVDSYSSVSDRIIALQHVGAIAPRDVGEEVRAALITALEREGQRLRQRANAISRGQTPELLDDPEYIFEFIRAVIPLQDPRAIPGLTGTLGTGLLSVRALVAFGDLAVSATVAVVVSSESSTASVDQGLVTLRMMVESQSADRRLSAISLAEIRRVAEYRLKTQGRAASNGVTLRRAIDLAAVLNDPALRKVIQAIASDPSECISRGVIEQRLIEKTQEQAADRLAGVPALPRR